MIVVWHTGTLFLVMIVTRAERKAKVSARQIPVMLVEAGLVVFPLMLTLELVVDVVVVVVSAGQFDTARVLTDRAPFPVVAVVNDKAELVLLAARVPVPDGAFSIEVGSTVRLGDVVGEVLHAGDGAEVVVRRPLRAAPLHVALDLVRGHTDEDGDRRAHADCHDAQHVHPLLRETSAVLPNL